MKRNWRSSALSSVFFGLVLVQTGALRAQPPAPGMKLVFEETFGSLDLGGGDRGVHRWFPMNSLGDHINPYWIELHDGVVTMETPPDERWGANTSIATRPDWPDSGAGSVPLFGPGYFEARLRYELTKNAWPAFWMVAPKGVEHATGRLAKSLEDAWCEIDIMEGLSPASYGGSVHDWKSGAEPHNIYNRRNNVIRLPAGANLREWNVFGALWTLEKITFYFNDAPMSETPTPEICKTDHLMMLVGAQTLGGRKRYKLEVNWIRAYD